MSRNPVKPQACTALASVAVFTGLFGAPETIKRGRDDLTDGARVRPRTPPPGHREGYIEAFTNLYSGFAAVIRAKESGAPAGPFGEGIPSSYDGLKGVAFVDAVVDSHEKHNGGWLPLQFA